VPASSAQKRAAKQGKTLDGTSTWIGDDDNDDDDDDDDYDDDDDDDEDDDSGILVFAF
jgi:hypothetical protein